MVKTMFCLKCDECGTETSIVAATKEALIESEVTNGPWAWTPPNRHACPACVLNMKPPMVRKPKPGVKVRGVNA